MNTNTFACDLQYKLIKKHHHGAGDTFTDWAYLDINGKTIKGSHLLEAKDGCEANRMLGWADQVCHCPSHNQRFRLTSEGSSEPLVGIYYEIHGESGETISGRTDEDGTTQKFHSSREEVVEIIIFR